MHQSSQSVVSSVPWIIKGNKVSRLEFIRLVKEWDPNTVDTNVDDLPDELPGESSTTTTSGGSSTEATPPTKKRKA